MRTGTLAVGVALALAAVVAVGGTYSPAPLTIDLDNQLASGDMYSARLSGNPDALIGCGMRSPAPGFTFGFCQAQIGPADDEYVSCFTTDPGHMAVIGTMDDFSWISFRWDADGNCTAVGSSTQSLYLPEFFKTDKVK